MSQDPRAWNRTISCVPFFLAVSFLQKAPNFLNFIAHGILGKNHLTRKVLAASITASLLPTAHIKRYTFRLAAVVNTVLRTHRDHTRRRSNPSCRHRPLSGHSLVCCRRPLVSCPAVQRRFSTDVEGVTAHQILDKKERNN